MKRLSAVIVAFAVFTISTVQAEQITTVAIIDLSKVMQSFYGSSAAVRQYKEMIDAAQADIDRQNEMIDQLIERKLAAQNGGDEATALRLDNEIFQKNQYLQEYLKIKTTQLQAKKASLLTSSEFYTEMLQAVENVSLTSGYSVVLDISDKKSAVILWYSKAVDITNDVIEELTKKVQ